MLTASQEIDLDRRKALSVATLEKNWLSAREHSSQEEVKIFCRAGCVCVGGVL